MLNLINTWVVFIWSPYIISLIGASLQALLLIGLLWFPITDPPKNITNQKILFLLKNIITFVYAFFGMMVFEMAFIWLLGPWGYADWRYQLPKVILGVVIGVEFMWGYLSRAKWYDFIALGISTIIYLLFLFVYLPSYYYFRPYFGNFTWILLGGLLFVLICSLFDRARFQHHLDSISIKGLDQSKPVSIHPYDRIFSRKVMIGILIFGMIDAFLLFYGYSLFSW